MTAALTHRRDHQIHRTVITADGVRLAVRDHHPGCPEATVVLLHGFCLTQASWSPQVHYLSRPVGRQLRILTYDHRGHGQSASAPMSTYRVEQLAEDLAQVLDRRRGHHAPDAGRALHGRHGRAGLHGPPARPPAR